MQLELRWITPHWVNDAATGNMLGYTSHAINLQRALALIGVRFSDTAKVALHVVPPHLFQPVPGCVNVCFSMWEIKQAPDGVIEPLKQADVLVVPSRFCQEVWRHHGLTQPCHVVPHGIWPEEWPYVERSREPGEPLKFLWVGAPNPRKGWQPLWEAWCQAFTPADPAALTIKTTMAMREHTPILWRAGRVTFDSRRLDWDAMRQLYAEHHCFVFPSLGEGYGLPLLEAMASGLLCIAPCTTGMREFFDASVGWPIDTEQVSVSYGVKGLAPMPKPRHLAELMREAVARYETTKATRERAALVARRLTWIRSAERLARVLARYA